MQEDQGKRKLPKWKLWNVRRNYAQGSSKYIGIAKQKSVQ